MILTGTEIEKLVKNGDITISPFYQQHINPNSYNLTLDNVLFKYKNKRIDSARKENLVKVKFTENGLWLKPGVVYLGKTVEKTFSSKYVPIVEGRSSTGRLGIGIHKTAGFGDLGFNGYWTLEISCVQPVKIYPFTSVAQVYWNTVEGDTKYQYSDNGKYNNNEGVQASMLWKEFSINENI